MAKAFVYKPTCAISVVITLVNSVNYTYRMTNAASLRATILINLNLNLNLTSLNVKRVDVRIKLISSRY